METRKMKLLRTAIFIIVVLNTLGDISAKQEFDKVNQNVYESLKRADGGVLIAQQGDKFIAYDEDAERAQFKEFMQKKAQAEEQEANQPKVGDDRTEAQIKAYQSMAYDEDAERARSREFVERQRKAEEQAQAEAQIISFNKVHIQIAIAISISVIFILTATSIILFALYIRERNKNKRFISSSKINTH